LGAVLLTGCNSPDDPLAVLKKQEMAPAGPPPVTIEQTPRDVQRRFQSGNEEDSGAVQNAVMWAQRYEEMSLKNNELREQNNRLFLENNQLKADTDRLRATLESTRKELEEANAFLQQMHVELNQWKSDVLGFRDEMRQAQRAQLEALAKILRVLGAEPVEMPKQP
jgi:chromosome segregation ATPase